MSMTSNITVQAETAFMRAVALHRDGRIHEARAFYEKALHLQPRHFGALHLMGAIALQESDPRTAAELIGRALLIQPHNALAHVNHGIAQYQLHRYEAAIASFEEGIALAYPDADVHLRRGDALRALQRWEAAVESYDAAIARKPDCAEAYCNRGTALYHARQFDGALASYTRAIAIDPHNAHARNNRGNVLRELKRHEPALADYDAAVQLSPDYAEAHFNRANALRELQCYEAAIAGYDTVARLNPDFRHVYGVCRYARMEICDWAGIDADIARIGERIERDEEACNPFFVLAFSDSAALQKKAAQIWAREECSPSAALAPIPGRARGDKIRIGYFSADFHNHATLYLLAGLLEMHDRSKYQLWAFSFGPDSQDSMRRRLLAAGVEVIDVRDLSDRDTALLARQMQIDIAVDLKGFTENSRPGIFAHRAAPLQVGFLGHPGTLGAEFIDYLVADRQVVPTGFDSHYCEKIMYLPNSYQVNDNRRGIAEQEFTRAELRLPQSGFVFCSFNNNYKITPAVFDRWMRMLAQVEGSVLWLLEDNPSAAGNLRREAARRGVNPERLIFAPRMDQPLHLARHRAADLFLDTLPCNAHTTASDSLWAGLPVLTCAGEAFAGRVAASLLHALDLPDLITTTLAQYEALGVELAANPGRLRHIKNRLADNRLKMPLFDTGLYTRHLEAGYSMIYERYHAGLPAEHIHVAG
jgi:predicted O-linked N-acetylglucosamine transferase (SPINDLY family)